MLTKLLYKGFSSLAEGKIRDFEHATHDPRAAQLSKLNAIIKSNEATQFGKEHSFEDITDWKSFANSVPIRDYEGFRPYIDLMSDGKDNVLTHQQPFMFATTSGTTGRPKYIPITDDYMTEFRHASVVSGYYLLKNFPSIANGTVLSMTSSAEEGRTPGGIPYGAMSGALFQKESFLMKRFISPIPYEAYLIDDYESRYYAILRLALELPTALFYTLNPSTIQLLCRRMQAHAESLIKDIYEGETRPPQTLGSSAKEAISSLLKRRRSQSKERARYLERIFEQSCFTPDKIWPTLSVVSCWTKAAAAFYLSDFPEYFGDVPVCDITYGASEGRGTVFLSPDKQPLAIHSHFFEFVPEDDIDDANPQTLLADELEIGKNYYILFTTSGGLYRYNLNDVIKVTGFHNRTPLLEFQYKGGNICSFTGEKITELQVTQAMSEVLKKAETAGSIPGVRFFTLIPQFRPEPHYELWIEPEQGSTGSTVYGSMQQGNAGLMQYGNAGSTELGNAGSMRHRSASAIEHEEDGSIKNESSRSTGVGIGMKELAEAFDAQLGASNIEYASKRQSMRLGPVEPRLIQAGTYESLRRHLTSQGTPDTQIKVSHLNPKDEIKRFIEPQLSPPYAISS